MERAVDDRIGNRMKTTKKGTLYSEIIGSLLGLFTLSIDCQRPEVRAKGTSVYSFRTKAHLLADS